MGRPSPAIGRSGTPDGTGCLVRVRVRVRVKVRLRVRVRIRGKGCTVVILIRVASRASGKGGRPLVSGLQKIVVDALLLRRRALAQNAALVPPISHRVARVVIDRARLEPVLPVDGSLRSAG